MNLTLRQVAGAAGVAVGNLTYYFPNKQALTRAVIEAVFSDFGSSELERLADPSKSTADNWAAIVQWLIIESTARKTSRVMRELWVMALHDPFAASALDDFYDEAIANGVAQLRKMHPALSEQTAAKITHLVTMITEGSNVLYGTRLQRTADLVTVARFATTLLDEALRERLPAKEHT